MHDIARRALGTFPGGIADGEFGLDPDQLVMIERAIDAFCDRLDDTLGEVKGRAA